MGQCLNDEKVDKYRQVVTQAYKDTFQENFEVPSATITKKCVSNIQCLAGDICYQGACQGYISSMKEIKDTHERYMAAKAATS